MADSVDRRSEGKHSNTGTAIASRTRRLKLKSAGRCIKCGHKSVHKRDLCYKCSDNEHIPCVVETNARRYLLENGIGQSSLATEKGRKNLIKIVEDLFSRGLIKEPV